MSKIVYVLTNPAMPDVVKIGITTRENPQVRMNELYTTGVPLPFECAIAIQTDDAQAEEFEKALHKAFEPYRLNPNREFFEIATYQVESLLRVLPGADVTPLVNEETDKLEAGEREAVKKFKSRRPNLNFVEMGIPIESTLVSVKTGEEATVSEDKFVTFREEEVSLTRATRNVLEIDHSVAPTPHWRFEGRLLQEIYRETYGDKKD